MQLGIKEAKDNFTKAKRLRRTGRACRRSFSQWDIVHPSLTQEIFNCCSEEKVNHCLRADFARYLPDSKVLILGLENTTKFTGKMPQMGKAACQISHHREGGLLKLKQMQLSQQFARALKWDVEDLSFQAVQY